MPRSRRTWELPTGDFPVFYTRRDVRPARMRSYLGHAVFPLCWVVAIGIAGSLAIKYDSQLFGVLITAMILLALNLAVDWKAFWEFVGDHAARLSDDPQGAASLEDADRLTQKLELFHARLVSARCDPAVTRFVQMELTAEYVGLNNEATFLRDRQQSILRRLRAQDEDEGGLDEL